MVFHNFPHFPHGFPSPSAANGTSNGRLQAEVRLPRLALLALKQALVALAQLLQA